jgi:hypothetical protein
MGFILVVNSCAIFSGLSVWGANIEIGASKLSDENKLFQQESGINLTYVKRGLYSLIYDSPNSMIELYYKSLLNNSLVFSVDDSKAEFAQQNITDDTIRIVINGQYQNYTDYEKMALLVASTSTLALLRDPNFSKNEITNMFFEIIGYYDAARIPGIVNTEWFKNRNLMITNDSIIIGAKIEPIRL